MSDVKLSTAEKRQLLVDRAKREGRGHEVREIIFNFRKNSLDGYQGDRSVTAELSREWARQMNELKPVQSSIARFLLSPKDSGPSSSIS